MSVPLARPCRNETLQFRVRIGRSLAGRPRKHVGLHRRRASHPHPGAFHGRFHVPVALRPFAHQPERYPGDARVGAVAAVLLAPYAEPLAEVPGQRVAVDRSRRPHPATESLLFQAPANAIIGKPEIEDHAVAVKMRIPRPAGPVTEGGSHGLGGKKLARPGATPDDPARMFRDDFQQRHADGIVVRPLDLPAGGRVGKRP